MGKQSRGTHGSGTRGLFDPYKIYEVWYDATGSKVIGSGFAGLEAEELLQHRMDPIRLILWDEMAAIDAEAAHVVGMVAPHLEDVIAASLSAMHPPQHEHRHPDLLREVRTVVYEVDRRAGAVLVAGGADRLRALEAAQVLVPRSWLDRALVVQQSAHHMAQKE